MSEAKSTSASLCLVVDTWEVLVSLALSSEPHALSVSVRPRASAPRALMVRLVRMNGFSWGSMLRMAACHWTPGGGAACCLSAPDDGELPDGWRPGTQAHREELG